MLSKRDLSKLSPAEVKYVHKFLKEEGKYLHWGIIDLKRLASRYFRNVETKSLSRAAMIRKLRVTDGRTLRDKLKIYLEKGEVYGGASKSKSKLKKLIRKLA